MSILIHRITMTTSIRNVLNLHFGERVHQDSSQWSVQCVSNGKASEFSITGSTVPNIENCVQAVAGASKSSMYALTLIRSHRASSN